MKSKKIDLKIVPEWFDIRKYATARDFDIYDWHFNIFYRIAMVGELLSNDNPNNLEADFDSFTRDKITSLLQNPALHLKPESKLDTSHQVNRPAVVTDASVLNVLSIAEDLRKVERYADGWKAFQHWVSKNEDCDPASVRAREALDDSVNKYRAERFTDSHAYIEVDLHAHLDDLVQAFTDWVKKEKACRNMPFQDKQKFKRPARTKNGIPTHDKQRFSLIDFNRWHRYAVLPYFDLKLWARSENVHFPDWLMVDALFAGQGGDTDREYRKYTKPLARDVFTQACIDLLRNQAGITL
ncbi:hypothetical protein WK62_19820 [Burkholderia ubonensis]|uniref:DUF6387 family protein n=1 Tax=Burkholderia ubonensis TaxID=101571 RepID=UPI00075DB4F5|nr:DUF6387 family protein [Burkholderia ubonensis]KVU21233.1 hypothetical protein WK62_19820 [Burkholderia ubonensis]